MNTLRAPPPPHYSHGSLICLLSWFILLFFVCIYIFLCSYLLVLLCSFACPVDVVRLYPDLRLLFTFLLTRFEPATWVNIIGTDMPSHFHLIGTYLSAPQEQRNKFQVWGNDQQPWLGWQKRLWAIKAAMGTKLESSLSSLGNLFNYALMIVALSLDGHALLMCDNQGSSTYHIRTCWCGDKRWWGYG
jgi:hypothetical protein